MTEVMNERNELTDPSGSPRCGYTDGGDCAGGVDYLWNLKNGKIPLCCKHATIVREMTPDLLENGRGE